MPSRHYLAELGQACPDRSNATAYARMVIEAALRRELRDHALRTEYSAGNLHYNARRLTALSAGIYVVSRCAAKKTPGMS